MALPYTFENGPGNVIDADQVNANFDELLAAIAALAPTLHAVGDLKATACAAAPSGWLMCDGAAVSRSTYAALFAAISTAYGTGDGSTTFNLPDLRGRAPVGVDGAAARLAANDALGQAGGAETHTLATSQMPSHQHSLGDYVPLGPLPSATWAANAFQVGAPGGGSVLVQYASGIGAIATTDITENTGGGAAHNNMQPYQVVNWMVKT